MWQTFLSQSCCMHCIYKVPFLSLPFTANLYDLWGYLFSNLSMSGFLRARLRWSTFSQFGGFSATLCQDWTPEVGSLVNSAACSGDQWPPSYPPIQGVVHIFVTKVVFSPTQCLKNALNVPLCHLEVEGRSPNTNFREIPPTFLE